MTFELPADPIDAASQLRSLEPQAPKHMKAVMIAAAAQLEAHTRLMADCASELEEAAKLRVGFMDSDSRAEQVTRQVRTTMESVAARLRA